LNAEEHYFDADGPWAELNRAARPALLVNRESRYKSAVRIARPCPWTSDGRGELESEPAHLVTGGVYSSGFGGKKVTTNLLGKKAVVVRLHVSKRFEPSETVSRSGGR
jgi:hypothetical protein